MSSVGRSCCVDTKLGAVRVLPMADEGRTAANGDEGRDGRAGTRRGEASCHRGSLLGRCED